MASVPQRCIGARFEFNCPLILTSVGLISVWRIIINVCLFDFTVCIASENMLVGNVTVMFYDRLFPCRIVVYSKVQIQVF